MSDTSVSAEKDDILENVLEVTIVFEFPSCINHAECFQIGEPTNKDLRLITSAFNKVMFRGMYFHWLFS